MKRCKIYIYSLLLILFLIVPLTKSNFLGAKTNEQQFFDKYRVGCKCCDGWDSDATGGGACSHHGGVQYWIYYDEDTQAYSYQYTGRCD